MELIQRGDRNMNIPLYYLVFESKMISGPFGTLDNAYTAKSKMVAAIQPMIKVVKTIVPCEAIE